MTLRMAGYAALMAGSLLTAVGWILFWMELVPALARMVRAAYRAARLLFLVVGWTIVIVRLVL